MRVYQRDSLAARQDQKGSVEENVLDIGYSFSRSNLTGGEGLDWFPRISGEQDRESDEIRFWDSANIDIGRPSAGSPYTLGLTADSAIFWTPATASTDMGASKNRLYVLVDQTVHRFNNTDDTTADDTDDLGVVLDQIAVARDNSVAVLDAGGSIWYKAPSTETYLQVYDATTDGPAIAAIAIWLAKGRIFAYCADAAAAADGILLEIGPVITGTPATPTEGAHTYTTIDTFGGAVLDLIDAGHAIVASFDDGSLRAYVPQADTAGATPVMQVRGRTDMPGAEVPYALGFNLGTLLVFTLDTTDNHARAYRAEVLDERFDFVVGGIQLLRTWEDSGESSPNYTKGFTASRESMHFWIAEATGENNLWHFDVVTEGLHRHNDDEWPDAKGLVEFEDELLWIDDGDIRQSDEALFQSDGYVITPNITFGLNTPINWVSFIMEATGLDTAGVKVTLWRAATTDAILDRNSSDWVLVTTLSDPAQSGIERNVVNLTSNTLALKLEFTPNSAATVSPEVQRFAVRGFPKHRDWIAEIPINISDMVEAPHRMPLHVPGYGDTVHNLIMSKEGAATDLVVLDPPVSLRGVVDLILEPTTYITDRGSQGKLCMLMFRGSLLAGTSSAPAGGNAGTGIAWAGVSTVGIGQTI
jgi:hypothetical protein